MKGIKIGIVGICVSLLGIAFAMNNFIAICGASIGLLLAVVGCFRKDETGIKSELTDEFWPVQ